MSTWLSHKLTLFLRPFCFYKGFKNDAIKTTANLVNFQMSIGQQNTSAHHLTIRYCEPTYFCSRKRPYPRMCKINSSRLTPESNRVQPQIIYSVCLCCFAFKKVPMNGNCWQTGGVEVAFSRLSRIDFLPLGQQYPPLNRKPRSWLPVIIIIPEQEEGFNLDFSQ